MEVLEALEKLSQGLSSQTLIGKEPSITMLCAIQRNIILQRSGDVHAPQKEHDNGPDDSEDERELEQPVAVVIAFMMEIIHCKGGAFYYEYKENSHYDFPGEMIVDSGPEGLAVQVGLFFCLSHSLPVGL